MIKKRYYKGIRVNSWGMPIFDVKKYDAKKVIGSNTKQIYYDSFLSDLHENSPKNLVIIYDIPEEMKKERGWFRRSLKKFNFVMIQRSVWVGPSPLPNEFLEYVKSIGLKNKFKTFKLAKPYSENNNNLY